jgi:hypothetical protein
VGLQLDIAVGCLPSYGTLMLDSKIINPNTGEEEAIQCAVHYVSTDEGIQYRVVPNGGRLELPNLEDNSLSDWVSGNSTWTKAETSRLRLPNEEVIQAPHLPVHVGSWPDASEYRDDMKGFAEKVLRIQKSRTGNRRTTIQNREQLRTVAASASPTTVLEGPSGFDSILKSGAFSVTVNVYFAPLKPFNPNPKIPESPTEAEKRMMSRQEIANFTYE